MSCSSCDKDDKNGEQHGNYIPIIGKLLITRNLHECDVTFEQYRINTPLAPPRHLSLVQS